MTCPLSQSLLRRGVVGLAMCFALVANLFLISSVCARGPAGTDIIAVAELPKQAVEVLTLIKQGGPFEYEKDGTTFSNREGVLPKQKRGYYKEYTVKTPRAKNRGARRIISGGDPKTSGEYYYTDDHYASFRRIAQ